MTKSLQRYDSRDFGVKVGLLLEPKAIIRFGECAFWERFLDVEDFLLLLLLGFFGFICDCSPSTGPSSSFSNPVAAALCKVA